MPPETIKAPTVQKETNGHEVFHLAAPTYSFELSVGRAVSAARGSPRSGKPRGVSLSDGGFSARREAIEREVLRIRESRLYGGVINSSTTKTTRKLEG